MKTKTISVILALCTLMLFAGCRKTATPTFPMEKLTKNGYFTMLEYSEKGKYGPVFIFPERHDSRLIQAEIGWALNTLMDSYGINSIALEGMYQGEVMTSEKLSYRTKAEKYNALLALLERGEIKAPEYMYLAEDSFVFGIENKAEYAVTLPDEASDAYFYYLLASIIEDKGAEALNSFDKKKGINELLSLNPWTYETYEIISKDRSGAKISKRLKELEKKVKKADSFLDTQTKTGFKQFKEFYHAAHKRSITMASTVCRKLRKNNEPLTMIIGAGHTDDITAYFNKKNVSYYVLEPSGLNAANVWSDLTTAEYERKEAEKSVFVGKQFGTFFDSIRNFRPRIQSGSFPDVDNSFMLIARMTIINHSRPLLESLSPDIFASNGIRVIEESLDISDPDDIMFELKKINGETLHVRAVRDINSSQFESAEKAFHEIIERLVSINEENLSPEQRIKAYKEVVAAFKVGAYAVYISPMKETLRQLNVSKR
jgi:hypothetical protein